MVLYCIYWSFGSAVSFVCYLVISFVYRRFCFWHLCLEILYLPVNNPHLRKFRSKLINTNHRKQFHFILGYKPVNEIRVCSQTLCPKKKLFRPQNIIPQFRDYFCSPWISMTKHYIAHNSHVHYSRSITRLFKANPLITHLCTAYANNFHVYLFSIYDFSVHVSIIHNFWIHKFSVHNSISCQYSLSSNWLQNN